jgi:hypothetical protein
VSHRVVLLLTHSPSTVATDYKHCGCKAESPRAEELSHLSYEWTRQHGSPEIKRYLGALPFRMDPRPTGGHKSRPQLILVHGTPTLNTLYWTEDRPDSFCAKMAKAAGARETWSPSAIPASPGTARSGAYTSSTPDRCRPKTGTSNAPSVDLAGTRSTRSNRLFSTACSASCRPL